LKANAHELYHILPNTMKVPLQCRSAKNNEERYESRSKYYQNN